MDNQLKNKTISIRLTEAQLLKLNSTLINEKRNMSEFLREQVEKYGQNCRKGKTSKKN